MTMAKQAFVYNPIGSQPGAFRLLRLKKGSGSRLEGELIHTTLGQDQGCYEAVSYTWGSDKIQDVIHLGDQQLGITYNLSLVLRDLRSPDADRVFWNDATCINQGDKAEQGQQVQQMGEIFRSARRVLFCIGRPTELTDFLLDSINDFSLQASQDEGGMALFTSRHIVGSEHILRPKWQEFMSALDTTHFMAKHRLGRAFGAIAEESWFQRIWIVQEVYLAQAGLVHIGRKSVPASVFATCARFIKSRQDVELQSFAARPVLELMMSPHEEADTARNLHSLITRFYSSRATNQYDRIYGLLGMATDASGSTSLRPDYNISTREVIENAVRHICQSIEPFTEPHPFNTIEHFLEDLCDSQNPWLLFWAVHGGYESVVRFLLDKGADASNMHRSKRNHDFIRRDVTPLGIAAARGHERIAKLLLERGADVNGTSDDGWTPLHHAASTGHEGIAKLLLAASRVIVDSRSYKEGQTPLHLATENGHESMVQLLVDQAADTEAETGGGETPLHYAADKGHEGTIKLLLATDLVKVNLKNKRGHTPLHLAAHGGYLGTVKLLLTTGQADPKFNDLHGETPLHRAANEGHRAVVKLLLATHEVSVNAKSDYGQTPLHQAAKGGHKDVVKLLLASYNIKPDPKDDQSQTPLQYATKGGHRRIVKMLLATSEVDINTKDRDGQTPLQKAAEEGHEAVVELLLARRKADVDSEDNNNQTSLHKAAKQGHEAVVKLLLATGQVYINSEDVEGQTPLHKAAEEGHDAVVELLLANGGANVNSEDKHSQTSLHKAAKKGHEAVVKLLLATDKVDVNLEDVDEQTPLHKAADSGHEAVVKLLLATGEVDVDSEDAHGATPLQIAANNGYKGIVELLLAAGEVDVYPDDVSD